jgi:two-component system, NtrC family, response regulator HydG
VTNRNRRGQRARILTVDDNPGTLELLRRNLAAAGFEVLSALSTAEAVELLATERVDLVVTDYRMPGASGLELVRYVRENIKDTVVMMISGFATVPGAVEAMKCGAEEYLAKPFTDDELLAAIGRALDKLARRRSEQGARADDATAPLGIIGESPAMRRVFAAIARAAGSAATVLVSGDSGTGKELVARAIHYEGPRTASPFVPVNCAGIPEGLLESELFGHVKGAFTGATTSRAGFFQTAEGGTLFLDEISETSPAMQAKLLRVLQDRQVCMVGSSRPREVDVRIIAASNKDLAALVHKERFRQDLYFRLNVLPIVLPPLRDREGDVLLLANRFAQKYAEEQGREPPRFTDAALAALTRYDWPGNVRELENVVQRLVVMSDASVFDVADLPPHMRRRSPRESGLDRSLAEVEAEHIRRVFTRLDGNKSRTARSLGIDRKTLRKKLMDYGIEDSDRGGGEDGG